MEYKPQLATLVKSPPEGDDWLCRVAFAEWTDDDKIRHPVYRGLAEDAQPRDVRR